MRAARVIVVVLCVCVYVCMYVYVCPLILAASHIGITKQRYQRIHRNTRIVLIIADFPKNTSLKSYGVICLPRAAPASYSFFPHEISFYASVKLKLHFHCTDNGPVEDNVRFVGTDS